MSSFLRTACATLAVLTLAMGVTPNARAQSASAQFKIAFVNMGAMLENAPGKAQAESTYARETRAYGDQLKRMSDSLNTMFAAYQKQEPTLTATQKETRQKALRDLQEQLQTKNQQLQQQAQQRQNELMAPIMEQVKKVLDDIRLEDGYSMIITGDPNLILSYDKNLDITDRVVARLKTVASAPAKTPGAPVSAPAGVTRKPQ
ncbi:MAG TPA: OmpH family outer membrane protein [Gemmatimonadaceae bacterium]|jgi:outer membrane protein|nr:OmpH family outer membrane protein [Gemmatimonadaceae bacterium]